MKNLSEDLIQKLITLRQHQGENIDTGDAAMVISELMDLMWKFQQESERNLYTEIKDIGSKIQQVKSELSEALPDGVVPEATKELDAVVKATEDATNRILDSVEKIQGIISTVAIGAKADEITEEITRIFEACNFQDITGQRIKKVTATLQYIEDAIARMLSPFEERENVNYDKVPGLKKPKHIEDMSNDDLMNGPQLAEAAPSQDDIDKLFNSF